MYNTFKEKLVSIRSSSEQVYKTSNDIKTICQEALKELDCYINIIPDFFSYKNEAIKIKELYKKLKELDYARNKVISCVNIDCAGYLYKEYFDGMYSFIDRFFKEVSSNSENVSLMEKQLQTAIQGDPLFIDSLFGGKNNEPVEVELTTAIKNVEYLVDFLDLLKGMKQMVADVCNRASELSTYEHCVTVVKLIVTSVCTFSNLTISGIMDIYDSIQCSIDNKTTNKDAHSFKVF